MTLFAACHCTFHSPVRPIRKLIWMGAYGVPSTARNIWPHQELFLADYQENGWRTNR